MLLPILIPLGLLARIWARKKTVDRTPDEVAGFIRDFLDESGGEWDWDEFESVPITGAALESIRQRAALAGPPDPDLIALRELLREAEAMSARG